MHSSWPSDDTDDVDDNVDNVDSVVEDEVDSVVEDEVEAADELSVERVEDESEEDEDGGNCVVLDDDVCDSWGRHGLTHGRVNVVHRGGGVFCGNNSRRASQVSHHVTQHSWSRARVSRGL